MGDIPQLRMQVTTSDTIFIPCVPALGTNNVTIWGIDGSLYPNFELPTSFTHQLSGLLVRNVSQTLGSNFKCYSFEKNTLQEKFMIDLSFNHPTVSVGLENQLNQNFPNSKSIVKVVSKGVYLHYSTNYTFQFWLKNVTSFCSPGDVMFTMNVTNSSQSLWTNYTNTYLPNFYPPKKYFKEKKNYAYVVSTNSSNYTCARLEHRIKVDIKGN